VKFDNLRLAFEVVQVPQEMVEGIFSVLSSVLWLGNMTFKVNLYSLTKNMFLLVQWKPLYTLGQS
jgi:myosin heavy subunit